MRETEGTLLEEHYPRDAPLRCPECNALIDLTTALLEDWDDPSRRLGCPRCGLWLVRNRRRHTDWVPLLRSAAVLVLLVLVVSVLALPSLGSPFERSIAQTLLFGLAIFGGRWIEHRTCFFVGPPLLPADGARADVGRR